MLRTCPAGHSAHPRASSDVLRAPLICGAWPARGGARMRGQAPSNSPSGRGSWVGTPLRGGRRKPLADASPNLTYLRRRQGKGRWSRASIDPCSSLVYSIDRRVNSAILPAVEIAARHRWRHLFLAYSAAPNGGRFAPPNHPDEGALRPFRNPQASDLSFVICHIIFRT